MVKIAGEESVEDWQKGSYYFSELSNKKLEVDILRKMSSTVAELERSIWTDLKLCEDAKIMDLGCGPGFISVELAKFFPSGTVVGSDVSQELLSHAKTLQTTEMLTNLSFKQSNIYNLDTGDNDFDLTYLRFVLQHLKRPVDALVTAAKVLKPGGTLCVVDIDDSKSKLHPCPSGLKSFNQKVVDGQAAGGGDRNIGSKLKNYLIQAGLRNQKVDIKTLSSVDIGIKMLLDLMIKTRYPIIPESQKEMALTEVEEIYSIADISGAWGTMDIFVATGTKI
jgi:ubiquinone/menaquinone biosynthesis C-methylase UbiE